MHAMSGPTYEEKLRLRGRQWGWFVAITFVTVLGGGVVLVPFVLLAWFYAVIRFFASTIKLQDGRLHVGAKSTPLGGLDLSTVGRAKNNWPWAIFSDQWLGAVPVWTKDSIGLTGIDDHGNKVRVALGTNRRDELLAALTAGVTQARGGVSGTVLPPPVQVPPGWYDDPWNPVGQLRWFDGRAWTGYTHQRGYR